jgi:hypothetical protein
VVATGWTVTLLPWSCKAALIILQANALPLLVRFLPAGSRSPKPILAGLLGSSNFETVFNSGKVRQKDPDRSYLYREHKVQIRLSGDRRMFGIPIEYAVSEITRGVGFE